VHPFDEALPLLGARNLEAIAGILMRAAGPPARAASLGSLAPPFRPHRLG
jgi:hypothetical protein